jgi:hypothetical protein
MKRKGYNKKHKHWECKERCITYSLTGRKVCKNCPIKEVKNEPNKA